LLICARTHQTIVSFGTSSASDEAEELTTQ
jgi:hypothetical protein